MDTYVYEIVPVCTYPIAHLSEHSSMHLNALSIIYLYMYSNVYLNVQTSAYVLSYRLGDDTPKNPELYIKNQYAVVLG